MSRLLIRALAVTLLVFSFAGCSEVKPGEPSLIPASVDRTAIPAHDYIKHVVIVIQENRSFVNLFRGFPGADAPTFGYAGTKKLPLTAVPLEDPNNIENRFYDSLQAWNHGRMNGFDNERFTGGPANFPYAYVPVTAREALPYWTLARRYVLADHMFPTEFGASFTGHLNLIAANTELDAGTAQVDLPTALPWGCDAPPGTTTFTLTQQRLEFSGPFPCFTQLRTMADTLDAADVSWKYYAPFVKGNTGGSSWSEFDAIDGVRHGPDWRNIVSPETTVLNDISAGKLPDVAWVIPDVKNSDHPGSGSNSGPSWVTAVVNAIGKSKYWKSTAIVVVWDDWGGWYDNARPPQLDFRGLGIRVPCLVISPYARIGRGANGGYISHDQYEFASVLKLVEDVYGLPRLGPASLGYTDGRARSLIDVFDFSQKPRAFERLPQLYSTQYLLGRRPSFKPPDDD
jgi:phospholipase C